MLIGGFLLARLQKSIKIKVTTFFLITYILFFCFLGKFLVINLKL